MALTRAIKPTIWIIVGVVLIVILSFLLSFILKNRANVSSQNDSVQIANPAAKYCQNQGDTYEIRGNESGQFGVCIINGTECDEWAFYRNECPEVTK